MALKQILTEPNSILRMKSLLVGALLANSYYINKKVMPGFREKTNLIDEIKRTKFDNSAHAFKGFLDEIEGKITPEINILVNDQGQVLIDDNPGKIRDIKGLAIKRIKLNQNVIFSVLTTKRTKYKHYIQVLDQLKQAKATKISIANPNF